MCLVFFFFFFFNDTATTEIYTLSLHDALPISDGENCAQFIEKELQARVMGSRADFDEEAEGVCPVCGKKASVVVYAGKSY